LINKDYDVVCLAAKDSISGISTDRLESLNAGIEIVKMDRKGTNPVKDFLYLLDLYRLYLRLKPDAVLNYTPKPNIYSSLACRILGIPYFNTINGLGSGFSSGFPLTTIITSLYRLALRKSRKVFVQNHDDLEFFIQQGISPKAKTSFIPGSGINTTTFQTQIKRNPQQGSLKFLFAGRLIKEKGVYDYIHIAGKMKRNYPGCSFWMVGFVDDGNPSSITLKELETFTASNVIDYKGKTDDIVEYLNATDVLVFPSTYREGLPRILLEAASCSMPIITYDIQGCREVVSQGVNGFLCPPGQKELLYQACKNMMNLSSAELVHMGEQGREKVTAEFSVELVNNYYLSGLEEII
jgi:glycosyltransferase involved in cell wall biosynthesis